MGGLAGRHHAPTGVYSLPTIKGARLAHSPSSIIPEHRERREYDAFMPVLSLHSAQDHDLHSRHFQLFRVGYV